MTDSRLRGQVEKLVQAELAMFTTGAALFGRWCEIVLESEKAAADRLSALAGEGKPVYPDSYERAAGDLLRLWRNAVSELARLPRVASMQYYAELAEKASRPPSQADFGGQ